MFENFTAALGLKHKQDEEPARIINLYDAVLAHSAWKKRLLDYVEGRSKEDLQPGNICADDVCVLGKWIQGDGKVQFGEQPVFIRLVEEHAKFHHHASLVVEAHRKGDTRLALEILAGSFDEQSRKTVNCLAKLSAIVGARNEALEFQ